MKIGFTSTIPVEMIFASGNTPVDLNNLFALSEQSTSLVARAKMDGFPDTTCSWICGLYTVACEAGIDAVIGVSGGDCSETIALMEVLSMKGIRIIPFSYPHSPNPEELQKIIAASSRELGTTLERVDECKAKLDSIRSIVAECDTMLWKANKGTGNAVRLLELSCTDFESDPEAFKKKVLLKKEELQSSKSFNDTIRLGICGVPPIVQNFYETIEQNGCRVVFSEVERQFSIPYAGPVHEAYSRYTYPYGIEGRIRDISNEIERRSIDGIIHYVQSFCFRGIEDIVLRKGLSVPVLTLQGDLPTRVTETMEIRIEAFIDMLIRRKERSRSHKGTN
jgi:benzoyl-CoA reductase/2-hydroxyglutaryl-CoA dehydratase subunit BcrC/BadD/HgdB